ncbi:hypothetical protein [Ruegeria sp. HKCCD8929]|uniref:hypothetical protein n=1 Tax=Ruegeria sp. HKCCD8929 TaxID=2683006 RepID=UPI00148837AA|nr:hypothetical protein [Ruegeria sp. HKCCD8929]
MDLARYKDIRVRIEAAGFAEEIQWAETVKPPGNAEEFAREAIYIICNSGMRWTVARKIFDAVMPLVASGQSASGVFGHKGKVAAIDRIWTDRDRLFYWFSRKTTDTERLEYLARLPWIGPITKYHLAKNLGVDCAKPDRWLVRLAEHFQTDPHALCAKLSEESGDRIATVDLVLWRAAERGILAELGQSAVMTSK